MRSFTVGCVYYKIYSIADCKINIFSTGTKISIKIMYILLVNFNTASLSLLLNMYVCDVYAIKKNKEQMRMSVKIK